MSALRNGPHHDTVDAPRPEARNLEWIISNNMNCHVAKDRSWFTTYTPFQSHATNYLGSRVAVTGIGIVEIEVKRRPGKSRNHVIRLLNVLHAPGATCNLFGFYGDFESGKRPDYMSFVAVPGCIIKRGSENWAYGERYGGLLRLKISGKYRGQTALEPDTVYALNAQWPEQERERWLLQQAQDEAQVQEETQTRNAPTGALAGGQQTPTIKSRNKIIKEGWGSWPNFMHSYGLKRSSSNQFPLLIKSY